MKLEGLFGVRLARQVGGIGIRIIFSLTTICNKKQNITIENVDMPGILQPPRSLQN